MTPDDLQMPVTDNRHRDAMRITRWTFQRVLRDAREAGLIRPADWQLCWVLFSHMDRSGHCYPSIPTLVSKLGNKPSESQNARCAKALRRLEGSGFIATVIGGGRHKSNVFYATATREIVAACGMQTPKEWPEQFEIPPTAEQGVSDERPPVEAQAIPDCYEVQTPHTSVAKPPTAESPNPPQRSGGEVGVKDSRTHHHPNVQSAGPLQTPSMKLSRRGGGGPTPEALSDAIVFEFLPTSLRPEIRRAIVLNVRARRGLERRVANGWTKAEFATHLAGLDTAINPPAAAIVRLTKHADAPPPRLAPTASADASAEVLKSDIAAADRDQDAFRVRWAAMTYEERCELIRTGPDYLRGPMSHDEIDATARRSIPPMRLSPS